MAKDNKNVQESDIKRLMEIALQLNTQEKGDGYTIADIKATAHELGISEDKINQAYQILEKEKIVKQAHTAALRKRSQTIATYTIIGLILFGSYFYFNRPTPPTPAFNGKAIPTLTSEIKENKPTNNLETFELFTHNKVICYVDLYDMKHAYKARWEFYKPNGSLHKIVAIDTGKPNGATWWIYGKLDLNLNDPVGTWTVKAILDEKPIFEKKFQVVIGKPDFILTSEVAKETPRRPLNIKEEFKKGIENEIICYVYWANLNRKGKIEFNWIDPQGKSFKKISLTNEPDVEKGGEAYYDFSTLQMADIKQFGTWKVEVAFEGVKFNEKNFVIKE